MTTERVTVTLPTEILLDIVRRERNRSKFVLEAVQHELARRRREDLRRSLREPHPDSSAMADLGLDDWAAQLPEEDADLLDINDGKHVRWAPGKGWVEVQQ